MVTHNGKTHKVAPCTNQRNCSLALVTAETKGSVSHIAAATSGWLPSNFSPLLEASLCSNSRRRNIISHTSGSTKIGQGLTQAVRAWWMQVLTWQCKSGNWVCMHHREICCQNNRSHGALSGWLENYFATCPVSLLASEVFYKMKPIFHKIKGAEYRNKLLHSTVTQVTEHQPNAKQRPNSQLT